MDYRLTDKWPAGGGTSLQDYFECSYADLVRVFGEPNREGDEYKVSTEWLFKDSKDRIYKIYDYKETCMYDSGLPSVTQFRELESYDWHIGAQDKASATVFVLWLRGQVRPEEKTDVKKYCVFCQKSPTGTCPNHGSYFDLAKTLTDPRAKDGVSVLFEALRQDMMLVVATTSLNQMNEKVSAVLARYEKLVRDICGDVGVIK